MRLLSDLHKMKHLMRCMYHPPKRREFIMWKPKPLYIGSPIPEIYNDVKLHERLRVVYPGKQHVYRCVNSDLTPPSEWDLIVVNGVTKRTNKLEPIKKCIVPPPYYRRANLGSILNEYFY